MNFKFKTVLFQICVTPNMEDLPDTKIALQMALTIFRLKGKEAAKNYLTKNGFGPRVIQAIIRKFENL